MLERRPFGETGEQATVIGLGGAALAKYSLADGVATARRALDLGVTFFDTAPAYGQGASQVILGTALAGSSAPYLLATKLGYLASPAAFRSPEALRAQLWENLRSLRCQQVDVLQVHVAERACWWQDGVTDDALVNPDAAHDFATAPVMEVLREAQESGLCRFVGITADRAEELTHVLRHLEVDACLVAYEYNLLQRQACRTALPLAETRGVVYIAAGILKPHLIEVHPEWRSAPPPRMSPAAHWRLQQLYDLQAASGLSLVGLGVRYLVGDTRISLILVGAATPAELEESVTAAQQGPLPPDLHRAIDALGLP
ncbi:MAG: hypothetical protein CL878_14175 [Dehalococcoidia bacterium]|nr:hypothetical protein [Dehalococcoidia bacterium]